MFRKLASFSMSRYAMTLFAAAVGIALKSLIAKTAGKEALGSYSYFVSLITIGTSVLSFGLSDALTKHMAAHKDRTTANHTNVVIISAYIVVALVLTSTALLLYRPLQSLNRLYPLALIALGPIVIYRLWRAILRGYLDYDREAIAILVEALARLFVVTATILLLKDATSPVFGLLGAYLLLGGIAIIATAHQRPKGFNFSDLIDGYRGPEIRNLIHLTLPLWVVEILFIANNQADRIIVQGQLGYAVLAEYAVAFTLIGLLDRPLSVMSRMFLATFAGGFYQSPEQYQRMLAIMMAFITSLGLLIVTLSPPLVAILFTDDYRLVPTLATILSIAFVLRSAEVLNSAQTIAIDYPQANRNARLLTMILYLPAAWLLVQNYGVNGAAWSQVFSWGCYTLAHLAFMAKRLKDHARLAFRQILISLIWYGLMVTAANMMPNKWLGLILVPVYIGGGHLLRLWDIREFAKLMQTLSSTDIAHWLKKKVTKGEVEK